MFYLLSFHSTFPEDILLQLQITGFSFLHLLEGWDIAGVELGNHSLKPNGRRTLLGRAKGVGAPVLVSEVCSRVSDSEEGSADTVRLPVRQCGGLHIYPSSLG